MPLGVYAHSSKFCSYRKLNSEVYFNAWCPSFIRELWWKASAIETMTWGSRLQLNSLRPSLYSTKMHFQSISRPHWDMLTKYYRRKIIPRDSTSTLPPGDTDRAGPHPVRRASSEKAAPAGTEPPRAIPSPRSGVSGQGAGASSRPAETASRSVFPSGCRPATPARPPTRSRGPGVRSAHAQGQAAGSGDSGVWAGDSVPLAQAAWWACSPSHVVAFQEYSGSEMLFNTHKICKANSVTLL